MLCTERHGIENCIVKKRDVLHSKSQEKCANIHYSSFDGTIKMFD